MLKNILFSVGIISILASCANYTTHDYDRSIDFSKYKTYNYFTDIEWGKHSALDSARFVNTIDREMKNNGFTKSSNPQLILDVQPSERQVTQSNSSIGIGAGSGGGNVGMGVSVGIPINSKKVEKHFVIEMVDAQNNNLIWQGIYDRTVSPKTQNETLIGEAVTNIFENFPPEKK